MMMPLLFLFLLRFNDVVVVLAIVVVGIFVTQQFYKNYFQHFVRYSSKREIDT